MKLHKLCLSVTHDYCIKKLNTTSDAEHNWFMESESYLIFINIHVKQIKTHVWFQLHRNIRRIVQKCFRCEPCD